jgi:rare lipoprotein A
MRLPAERTVRRARRYAPALILVSVLAGCGSHDDLASASGSGTAIASVNGPAADYPVVIGDPYRIGATLYTPADTMNYDAVGYAAADNGSGVTGAHHTMPLPSYVEVTSLETGRTILVRLERRGPMSGDAVVALSPAAFAQLGAGAGTAVRVRRVNPPEEERAALRAGRSAPQRMDTPASLVAVLKRKLPGEGAATLSSPPAATRGAIAAVAVPPSTAARPQQAQPAPARQTVTPASPPSVARNAPPPLPPLASRGAQVVPARPGPVPVVVARLEQPQRAVAPMPAVARPDTSADDGRFLVQAAAMSTYERAEKVAGAIGGSVSQSGRYYRVHTGPFATREQAEASLAKVRAAGYSDARIYTNG